MINIFKQTKIRPASFPGALKRFAIPGLAAVGMVCSSMSWSANAESLDLTTATIEDINHALDSGALTIEKLTRMYLDRIEAYNDSGPKINAIITLNPDAMEIAKALDEERKTSGPRSPLHGIPVVLKDLFDTKDMPTSGGFLPFKDVQPIHDAFVVKKLRDAGAIILAKVNMSDWFGKPEGGAQSTVLGMTLNPYNLELTPGGSSGGTGAALAAVFAQIGLGTETGVSIRNPTSNNSLVGLAPTRGLISRTGQIMTSFHQERCGPMGRSVYDVAAMTDVVSGFDAEDLLTISSPGRTPEVSYTSFLDEDGLRGARIGVFRDLFREGAMHEEGVAMIEAAIAVLEEKGATIVDPVSTGLDLFPILANSRLNYWEGQFSYTRYFRRLGPDAPVKDVDELVAKYRPLLKSNIVKAYDSFDSLMQHKEYLSARDTQEMLKEQAIEIMDKYRLDALVYPFKSAPAEPHGERHPEKDNPFSSITGLPAVLVPAGYTKKENGPISIEFLGRPFSEPTLFKLAYAYEQASKIRKTPEYTPPLPGECIEY